MIMDLEEKKMWVTDGQPCKAEFEEFSLNQFLSGNKLDFLDKGKKFEAQIYRDGDKAEWVNNPYDLKVEKRIVTADDKLTLKLATSGGTAIRFKAM